MARPTHGSAAKAKTQTAMRAFVAAKLAQRDNDATYLRRTLRLNIDPTALRKATGRRRWRPGVRRQSAWFRDWQLVDEWRLGISVELVRLPCRDADKQDRMLQVLRRLPGVRQLMATADGRSVFAVILYDGDADASRLFQALVLLAPNMERWPVEREDFRPAVVTWRQLARLAARREGLG